MQQLKGLGSLLVIVTVVWGALRALHVLLALAQPEVLPGPFELESLAGVEAVTGFPPRVPIYHPASLGNAPVQIIARREPEREVIIVWRGDRLLELVERTTSRAPQVPVDAEPVAGLEEWWMWTRGGALRLSGTSGGARIDLRTNLSREDAVRVASSLRPVDEVR